MIKNSYRIENKDGSETIDVMLWGNEVYIRANGERGGKFSIQMSKEVRDAIASALDAVTHGDKESLPTRLEVIKCQGMPPNRMSINATIDGDICISIGYDFPSFLDKTMASEVLEALNHILIDK